MRSNNPELQYTGKKKIPMFSSSGGLKFVILFWGLWKCLLLRLKSQSAGKHLTIQLLWATARLLVTRLSLIYQRSRWVFLVTSVNQENRRQGEPKIPLYNSSGGNILLRPSSSHNKFLGRVAFRILSNILSKMHNGALLSKAPLQMFDWIPHAPPIVGTVNVESR